MAWLPENFQHPERVDLPTEHHLRPIRERDVDIDYPAVMSSQPRLWVKYGEAWGWPTATMTYEQDRVDLARHEREINAQESFNYAVLDERETRLLGCIYIDPPEGPGADAEVSWWVVDDMVGSELARRVRAPLDPPVMAAHEPAFRSITSLNVMLMRNTEATSAVQFSSWTDWTRTSDQRTMGRELSSW